MSPACSLHCDLFASFASFASFATARTRRSACGAECIAMHLCRGFGGTDATLLGFCLALACNSVARALTGFSCVLVSSRPVWREV